MDRPSRAIGVGLAAVALAAVLAVVWVALRVRTQVVGQNAPPAEALNQDLENLRKVDPALVHWREARRFATGFAAAQGLALGPGGRVFVAGDRAVRVFGPDGARQSEVPVAGEPTCLAVAPDGTLTVGFRDHVEVYAAGGKRTASWASRGERGYFTSLAVEGDAIWAADAGNRVVLRYSKSGKVTAERGRRDDERKVPGLVVPSPHLDVAAAPGGEVWVSNPGRHQVEAYGPRGEVTRSWGAAGAAIERFSGCCNPTDFALLPAGGFVTSEKGLPRVKEYDAQGRFVGVVAGPDAFAQGTAGIDLAVDDKGRVLLLDPKTREVRVYERKGQRNER